MQDSYKIYKCDTPDWSKAPRAEINNAAWDKTYTPESYGQVLLGKDALHFKLTCVEKEPLATYTKYGEPVHLDSCLEFFCALDNESPYYLNFEANANGAFVCAKRPGREGKTPIDRIVDINDVKIKSVIEKDSWSVEFTVPFTVIEKLYRPLSFEKGYIFKGNMYKCGDNTKIPHWLSLFPITNPEPDFHRPEFFGDFEICE